MKAAEALCLVAALAGLSCLKNHRHLRRLVGVSDRPGIVMRWEGNVSGSRAPGSETFDGNHVQRLPYRRHEEGRDGSEASFSACLMWMDDNFQLSEWIAYHYHTMNLRYLVVHPDPRSKSSPHEVLEGWKDRMTVVVWSPANNFTTFRVPTFPNDSLTRKTDLLVRRQVHFYQSCALYLKSQNRTWTSFHDVDEYIVVRSPANYSVGGAHQGEQGAIQAVVEKYSGIGKNNSVLMEDDPSHTQMRFWNHWFSHKPCLTIPRVLFGAVPSTDPEVFAGVPSFVDARQFNTLNWRYPATPPGVNDGLAKSIMDVSRIPANASVNVFQGSPHRPFTSMCAHAFPPRDSLPLVIHHYLGSWEAFSHRDGDARKGGLRTFEKWQNRSALRYGAANDDARPWIRGFVEHLGEEAALALLQGAGLPRGYTVTQNQTASWSTMPPGS